MTISAQAFVILAFNANNQLAVRRDGTRLDLAFVGSNASDAAAKLATVFPTHTPPTEYFTCEIEAVRHQVCFTQTPAQPSAPDISFLTLEQLALQPCDQLTPALAAVLTRLEPHLIEIPYLHLGENDYIYKFRVERDRNHDIYQQDAAARALLAGVAAGREHIVLPRRTGWLARALMCLPARWHDGLLLKQPRKPRPGEAGATDIPGLKK